jgi:pimeloyl-ACP methyl ester carboxylesterase
LLHAAASHPQTFQRLAESLQKSGREILAPALNGYGSSALSNALDPFARHVAIARAAIAAAASPTRTCLFGHSMGGLVALLTALETPTLRRLVLYDPIITAILDSADPIQRASLNWDRAIIKTLCDSVGDGNPETGVACFVESWNETRWHDLPSATRKTLISQATSLARDAPTVSYFDLDVGQIKLLRVPTTVACGAQSPAMIGLIARELEAHRAEYVTAKTLPNCGHMAPIAQAAKVAATVSEALD